MLGLYQFSYTQDFVQQAKLAYAPTFVLMQGKSVALSEDGNTLAVGPGYYTSVFDAGAVWIFVRSNSTWAPQVMLYAKDAIGYPAEGFSVSLSTDGNTLAFGGPFDNNGIGAAWVFVRTGVTWLEQTKLVGLDYVTPSYQGSSVSLSGNGDTLAVGAPANNSTLEATWVFTRSGTTWTEQAKLLGTNSAGNNSQQGWSVALSRDGNTLAVGGPFDNNGVGAVWIFVRLSSTWLEQAKLVGMDYVGSGANQGTSVALSEDGNTLAIGGPFDNSSLGATWVFTRVGTVWTLQEKLIGAKYIGTNIGQGTSVSLSGDGNKLAVGGPNDDPIDTFPPQNVGATWFFARFDATWIQQDKLVGSDYLGGSEQGSSVSISSNGSTLAIGGPYDSGNNGAVWIFEKTAD